tara:strand:+ start:2206 stop:2727 length:522 start_codon:yes stop_codon:yes gene_type:complete
MDNDLRFVMENWRSFINEAPSAATIGDLMTAVEILRSQQERAAKVAKLKKVGGAAARIGLGIITGGMSEAVQNASTAVEAINDLYDAATDPTAINSGKMKNMPWLELLGIDQEFSKIIEDDVERQFLRSYIQKYTTGLGALGRNNPIPNFTNLFAKWLNKQQLKDSPLQISNK